MRHLIHVTRTVSGTKELAARGATTVVRYHALAREMPEELERAEEAGEGIDHRRDEEFLASEVARAGDPEVVIALGFAVGACAAFARRHGATVEALLELDASALDEEQRAKLEWLLETLRRMVGREQVKVAPPSTFQELLDSSVAHQQN